MIPVRDGFGKKVLHGAKNSPQRKEKPAYMVFVMVIFTVAKPNCDPRDELCRLRLSLLNGAPSSNVASLQWVWAWGPAIAVALLFFACEEGHRAGLSVRY